MIKRRRSMFLLALCSLMFMQVRLPAGDVTVMLDSTNGSSAFLVYDQQTNLLLQVASDGAVTMNGELSASVFSGSGAQLTGITSASLARGYESGSLSLQGFVKTNVTTFAGWEATTNIIYSGTYTLAPVVTLTLESAARAAAEALAPFVTDRSQTHATITLAIPAATPQTVDAATVQYASFSVINGRPAVAYELALSNAVIFSTATDVNGAVWNPPVYADTTTSASDIELSEVAGRPAIAWKHNLSGFKDLMYMRASNAAGSAWGAPVTVHSSSDSVGEYASLAIVNGNPAIAYYNSTKQDLMYVRAADPIGSTWGTPVTVYSNGFVGTHCSLEVVNSLPAIAFYDGSNDDLLYIRASDISGATWPVTAINVYTNADVGKFASLSIVDTYPAVSFYDETDDDILYVRATDANGTAWDTPVAVYTNNSVGKHSSLAVIDDNPAVVFYDATDDRVLYVRSSNSAGTSWGNVEELDPYVFMATGSINLRDVNGSPAAGYSSTANDGIYYIRAGNPPVDTTLNWIAVEP